MPTVLKNASRDNVNLEHWDLVYGINSGFIRFFSYAMYSYLLLFTYAFIAYLRSVSTNTSVKETLAHLANQKTSDKLLFVFSMAGFGALFYIRSKLAIRMYRNISDPQLYSLIWYNAFLSAKRVNFQAKKLKWLDTNSSVMMYLFGNMKIDNRSFIIHEGGFLNVQEYQRMRKFF